MKQRWISWVVLAGIVAVAVCVRAHGAWWDQPYHYDVDEPFFVDRALTMIQTGDFNPYWFGHPGSVWIYVLAAVDFVIATVGGYGQTLAQYPEVTYGVARGLNIAFGAGTAVLVYVLARRLSLSRWVGLCAAAIIAVAPLHIEHSRLARTDILATFLIMVALVVITRVEWKQRWWQWRWFGSGFVTGLAIATKYPAAVLGATLALFAIIWHMISLRGSIATRIEELFNETVRGKTPLISLAAGGFAGFTLGTPYFWFNLPIALVNLLGENRTEQIGHERLAGIANYLWYFHTPLVDGIGGLLLALLALLGVGYVLVRYRTALSFMPLLLFPILYILFIGSLNLRWERWIIPLLPVEALFAALGVECLWIVGEYLIKKWRLPLVMHYLWAALLIGGVIALLYGPFQQGYQQGTALLQRIDTRTTAKEWIEQNLPAGSVIVYEENCPRLEIHSPPEKRFVLINQGWKSVFTEPLDSYRARGVNYIVLSTWVQHDLADYNPLREQARFVQRFNNDGDVTQPEIEIFELSPVALE